MRDRWLICLLIAGHANAGGLLFAGAGARSGGWAEIQESGNIVLSRQNAQNVSLASASSADLQLDLPLSPDSAYHLWAAQSRHSLLPFNAGQLRIRYAQLAASTTTPRRATACARFWPAPSACRISRPVSLNPVSTPPGAWPADSTFRCHRCSPSGWKRA